MKKKQFKKICKMIRERRKADYQRKIQYRINFMQPLSDIEKENPGLYDFSSEDDSGEDNVLDKRGFKIRNARSIALNESNYLDKYDGESDDSLWDEAFDLSVLTNQAAVKENQSSAHVNVVNSSIQPKVKRECVLKEINTLLDPIVDNQDIMDEFFLPKELTAEVTLKSLTSWFPLYVNGVCRFIGKLETKRRGRFTEIVTETVFDYNAEECIIITNDSCYKLIGDMDNTYLSNYTTAGNIVPVLSRDTWLHNCITLSKIAVFGNKTLINSLLKNHSHKALIKLKSKQLLRTSMKSIFARKKRATTVSNESEIRLELRNIVEQCQVSGGSWLISLEQLLKKCGQDIDAISKETVDDARAIAHDPLYQNVDIDEPNNYGHFASSANICNSTLSSAVLDLYLWAIMKNSTNMFCVTGLVKSGKKYIEVNPTPIKAVYSNGTCVLTETAQYNLMGPLYKLSLHCCYPKTDNGDYLDLFWSYFERGLPIHWKSIISVAHILCHACTKLSYYVGPVNDLSNRDSERSPSFESVSIIEAPNHETDIIILAPAEDNHDSMLNERNENSTVSNTSRLAIHRPPQKRKLVESSREEPEIIAMPRAKKIRRARDTGSSTARVTKKRTHRSLNATTASGPRFSIQHKSLQVKERDEDCHLIYRPTIGFPVDLHKIPITRSGRLSLPPPDPFTRTRFEKVGNEVRYISQSVMKMVFEYDGL